MDILKTSSDMKKYVALLRGINISGQKLIKMAELRAHMEGAGFQDVETYIQSGNIVFNSTLNSTGEVEVAIINMIKDKYGFDVPTLVKQASDLDYVLDNCPYFDPSKDITRIYVTFLDGVPADEQIVKLAEFEFPPEEYCLDGSNVYFYSPLGYGNAKMNNNFFEAKLKVAATTRNWKTVNRLAEMSKSS